VLHGIDRQIEFYAQMKDIQERLDHRFYRCHKAFLVNKDCIKEIDTKKRIAYMINGESCPISFRSLKKLIE
jgi:two-component system response regulator AgrA